MSNPINSLNTLPDASGYMNNARSPRQTGTGYGGYTGLNAGEEAYARQFGDQAQNGNFWRGAALWTGTAALAGGATVAMERQWLKESHGNYATAKGDYLLPKLTDEHLSLLKQNEKVAKALGDTTLQATDKLQAINNGIREGYVKNSYKFDNNPYKELNKLLGQANDVAKVELNKIDPTKLADDVKLTNTTGLGKAGIIAGAVLAGGLLISHFLLQGKAMLQRKWHANGWHS